jgi:hypothetical protein
MTTISNTPPEYEKISKEYKESLRKRFSSSPLSYLWFKMGLMMGYLKDYWKIRLKYFLLMKK